MGLYDTDGSGPQPQDLRWWLAEDDEDLARRVFAAGRSIISANSQREEVLWRNVRMYNGLTREAFWGESDSYPLAGAQMVTPYKANRNVVASIIDTLTATITATPIKNTVLSEGADYSRTKKRSKIAEQFINGVKYNSQFELRAAEVFLAACVCDLGIVKVFEDEENPGHIKLESVFPAEIVVDEVDGIHRNPRQIMQRKLVARETLKELYPDFEEEIENTNTIGTGLAQMTVADKVEVVEAWHLASGPDAKDGLHVICLDRAVLYQEEWTLKRFPFVFMRPNLSMFGFFGHGPATDLVGVQFEINQLAQAKQKALALGSNFMVLLPTGSRINKNHLLNGIGLVLEYTGDQPPSWYTPNPVSQQLNDEIKDLIAWAYQRWGVSQLTAQSLKPEGLDSGQSLRTFAQIESVRHSPIGKAFQQMHLDVGELILLTARQMDERYETEHKEAVKKGKEHKRRELTVRVPDETKVMRISWKDADPGDGFFVKHYATNLFADTPSDRLAQLGDLVSKGALDMDTFLDLNPYPDLEIYNKIRNAPRENIFKQIDDMIMDGKYRSPEPFQNLTLGLQLMQSALLDAEDNGVSEDRLAMLQRWIGEAKMMLTPPPPPPQAPAPGAGPVPPMPAMMPPPPGAVPPGVAAQPMPAPTPAPQAPGMP